MKSLEPGCSVSWADLLAAALLALIVGLYCLTCVQLSLTTPLWMDEVLAAWVARLGSGPAIWLALSQGAEFSPPGYQVLLHVVSQMIGGSRLALRIPSILAVLVSGMATFLLLRRRMPLPFAALAMTLTMQLGLFAFAVQVRQYALVAACFSVALLMWDTPNSRSIGLWRVIVMTTVLCLTVSLHFYSLILIGAFMIMETLWTFVHCRLRLSIWIGLVVATASVIPWLPLVTVMRTFNAGDVTAASYYGKPLLGRLFSAYADLMLGESSFLLLAFLFSMALAPLLRHLFRNLRAPLAVQPERELGYTYLNLDIMTVVLISVPLIVFAFALLVTKTFNERYAVVASIGFSILYVRLIRRLPNASRMACGLLVASSLLWSFLALRSFFKPLGNPPLGLLQQVPSDDLPIVIGEGRQFFELMEAADPDLKRRLVYVTVPLGIVSPDPTNENQVKRWIKIRTDLKIVDSQSFLRDNPTFHLLHTSISTDVLTGWLAHTGRILDLEAESGDCWLFKVGAK